MTIDQIIDRATSAAEEDEWAFLDRPYPAPAPTSATHIEPRPLPPVPELPLDRDVVDAGLDLTGSIDEEDALAQVSCFSKSELEESGEVNPLFIRLLKVPAGFPAVIGGPVERGCLDWLDAMGVWSDTKQRDLLIQVLRCFSKETGNGFGQKFTAKSEKKLLKDWKGGGAGKAAAARMARSLVLLPMPRCRFEMLHPQKRLWLDGPHAAMIRASERFAGRPESTTLDVFETRYNTNPAPFWAMSFADPDAPLSEQTRIALGTFLHETLELAQHWEALSDKEKNGVLLGAFGAAAIARSTMLLLPFCAVHPEIKTRLRMDDCGGYLALSDAKGEASLTQQAASNIIERLTAQGIVGEEDVITNVLHLALAPIIADTLYSAVRTPDAARASSSPFFFGKLTAAVEVLSDYIVRVTEEVDDLSDGNLPTESIAPLMEFVEEVGALATAVTTALDDNDASITDFAPVYFEQLTEQTKEKPSLVEFLDEYWEEHDLCEIVKPSAFREHKARLVLAAQSIDMAKLRSLTEEVDLFTAHLTPAFEAYAAPELKVIREVQGKIDAVHAERQKAAEAAAAREKGADVAQSSMLVLESEIEALQADRARLERELEAVKAEAHKERTHREALAQSQQRPVSGDGLALTDEHPLYHALGENASLLDVVESLPSLFGAQVKVLDSARDSAMQSDYKLAHKAASKLLALCGPYRAAIEAGVPDTTAREILGQCYRAQESQTTLSTQRLRAQREFMVDGEKVLFKQHLTVGGGHGSQHCMQVYFQVVDGVVVIAYVGRHLDTATS